MKPGKTPLRRCKARFIIEARYRALVGIFDRRGEVLEGLNALFQRAMEQWQVQNAAVHLSDNFNLKRMHVAIEHTRTFIAYEDICGTETFLSDASRLFSLFRETFASEVTLINRLGVRHICIYESPSLFSFAQANQLVMASLFSPQLPLSITVKDCRAVFNHNNGTINIGPMRADEDWAKQSFVVPFENVPKHGIGIDIDSYAKNVDFSSEDKVLEALSSIQALTIESEKEVIEALDPGV